MTLFLLKLSYVLIIFLTTNVFSSRELLKVLEKAQVEKPSSEMVTQCEQQVQQQN